MDVIGAIKEVFGAIRATEDKLAQREKLNNTPEMQAAAGAQQFQKDVDAGKKAVQNEDLDEVRRRLSGGSNP